MTNRPLRILAPVFLAVLLALVMNGCDEPPTPDISDALSDLTEVSPSPEELSRAEESMMRESAAAQSAADESIRAQSVIDQSIADMSIIEESLAEESRISESIYNESTATESRISESIYNASVAEESRLEESRIAHESRLEESRIAKKEREESLAEESRREESRIAEESRQTEESIANDLKPVKVRQVYVTTTQGINRDEYVTAIIRIVDRYGEYETILDRDATIKVRGNSTSSADKKPYNFKLSEKTSVFGLGKSKKWCLLSNPYDKTLMRNKLGYDFALALGISYTSQSDYVDLYINGVYAGNYLLTESVGVGNDRVDIDMASNDFLFEFEPWVGYSNLDAYKTKRYGVLLGYNDRDYPTQEDIAYLDDFFTKAEDALHTRQYKEVEKYYDIDSFVNFYIVNELFKNVDIGTSSTRYYIKDDMLYAGPVWDVDLSTGNCSATYYTGYNNVSTTGDSTQNIYVLCQWYSRLLQIPEFSAKVKARYKEIQPLIENLTTDNSLGKNRIDRLISRYGVSFHNNYILAPNRIDIAYSVLDRIPDPTYDENVEYLRDWIIRRNEWLLNYWGIS